jgi:hypothetical protein
MEVAVMITAGTFLHQSKQVRKLFGIYKAAHGHDPSSLTELERWMATPEGQTALTPHIDLDGKVIADRAGIKQEQVRGAKFC